MSSDALTRLMHWYAAHCDGDWEHQHGVSIDTLDNPGWRVAVDVAETELAGVRLDDQAIERTERDWLRYRIRDQKFEGYCGPGNLSELLTVFLEWSQRHR